MKRINRVLACLAITAGFTAPPVFPSLAQESQPKSVNTAPLAIGGFKYSSLPQGVHMFDCQDAKCGAGSKVSYVVLDPRTKMTFEDYKTQRQQLAAALRARASPGTEMIFQEPVDKSDKLFRMFQSRREIKPSAGPSMHTVSTTLIGPKLGFDIISSAGDLQMADANIDLFILAAMLLAVGTN